MNLYTENKMYKMSGRNVSWMFDIRDIFTWCKCEWIEKYIQNIKLREKKVR